MHTSRNQTDYGGGASASGQPTRIRIPASVRIGGVRFLGHTPRPESVTLFFAREKRLRKDLVIFTHLYPESPECLPPGNGPQGFFNLDHRHRLDPATWEKGEIVADVVYLDMLPPGRYEMRFGLYDMERNARLPVDGSGDGTAAIRIDTMRAAPPRAAAGPSSAFSVILCTHNRAAYLRKAVRSLFDLDYPRDLYEVIVVDNASTDGTREAVAELRAESPVTFSCYEEPRLGLSHARNTGIRHSRFDQIAYLDDDAAADRRWLAVFDETLRSTGADVVGGRVVPTPVYGYEPPPWFHSEYVWGFYGLDYARYGLPEKLFRIRHPHYIGGGNSCYRKALMNLPWARFHDGLGRTGERLYQGEETLLNYFLEMNGYSIYYNADAIIYHFIDPERVTRRFVRRKAFWGGYSDALMHRKMFGRGFVARRARQIGTSLAACLRERGDDSRRFEARCRLLHDAGYLLRLARFWDFS